MDYGKFSEKIAFDNIRKGILRMEPHEGGRITFFNERYILTRSANLFFLLNYLNHIEETLGDKVLFMAGKKTVEVILDSILNFFRFPTNSEAFVPDGSQLVGLEAELEKLKLKLASLLGVPGETSLARCLFLLMPSIAHGGYWDVDRDQTHVTVFNTPLSFEHFEKEDENASKPICHYTRGIITRVLEADYAEKHEKREVKVVETICGAVVGRKKIRDGRKRVCVPVCTFEVL